MQNLFSYYHGITLEINIKRYLNITHLFSSEIWHLSREVIDAAIEGFSIVRRQRKGKGLIAEKKAFKWEINIKYFKNPNHMHLYNVILPHVHQEVEPDFPSLECSLFSDSFVTNRCYGSDAWLPRLDQRRACSSGLDFWECLSWGKLDIRCDVLLPWVGQIGEATCGLSSGQLISQHQLPLVSVSRFARSTRLAPADIWLEPGERPACELPSHELLNKMIRWF